MTPEATQFSPPLRHSFRAAIVLSLLLHAGGLVVLSQVGTHDFTAAAGEPSQLDLFQGFTQPQPQPQPQQEKPKPPPAPPPQQPPPPDPQDDPQRLRLGIDDGADKAEAWKGAPVPTEHSAPKSQVDQPALSPSPGTPGPPDPVEANPAQPTLDTPAAPAQPAPQTPPAPATDPAPQAKPQPLPIQDQPEQPQPKQPLEQQPLPQQPDAQQPIPAAPAPGELELPPTQPQQEQPLPFQPAVLQDREQQLSPLQLLAQLLAPLAPDAPQDTPSKDTQPAPPTTPAPPPAPPTPPAPHANAPDAQPGEKAHDESAPAAVAESLVFRPGQPLAGKGLDVRTVNPRWGVTTMLTASPRNPIIRIKFGRDGHVLHAAFIGEGTGYPDVDGPLLDAVYRWAAQGEALKKIPAGDPQAGLIFDIKFLINGVG